MLSGVILTLPLPPLFLFLPLSLSSSYCESLSSWASDRVLQCGAPELLRRLREQGGRGGENDEKGAHRGSSRGSRGGIGGNRGGGGGRGGGGWSSVSGDEHSHEAIVAREELSGISSVIQSLATMDSSHGGMRGSGMLLNISVYIQSMFSVKVSLN